MTCVAASIPTVTWKVRVATPETLYAMKRDTLRLQDKADAQKLKEKFGLKD
jgi:hypothetical protein